MLRFFCTLLIFVALSGTACKIQNTYYSDKSTVASMELTTRDISGWNNTEKYAVVVGQALFAKIDGGATPYLSNGMLEAGYQWLSGSKNELINTTVMDFGEVDNAQKMFMDKKNAYDDQSKFSNFNTGAAVYNSQTMSAVATFKNFYIEIDATSGFADKIVAMQTMEMFLRIYKAKIN